MGTTVPDDVRPAGEGRPEATRPRRRRTQAAPGQRPTGGEGGSAAAAAAVALQSAVDAAELDGAQRYARRREFDRLVAEAARRAEAMLRLELALSLPPL